MPDNLIMLHTITNLYPYPGQPTRGLFNLQLFRELQKITPTENHTLVASLSPLAAAKTGKWSPPPGVPSTGYIPYQHIPLIGRNLSWRMASHALQRAKGLSSIPQNTDTTSPDQILASWLYPDGCATAHAFRRNKTPLWIMVLGTDRFHLNNCKRRSTILALDQRVTGYICVSQNIVDDCATAGLPREKLHLIRNGVDTAQFHVVPTKDALQQLMGTHEFMEQIYGNDSIMLWIGNFVEIKNPELAVKSFADYIRGHSGDKNKTLVMIGDGPLRESTEATAQELGISDRVIFAGTRPHTEIPLWMNIADCLMLSSKSEGMPNAIAEALACGCPVVATDVGACREMLANHPCTQTVAPDDSKAMADALIAVILQSQHTKERPTFKRTWADMAQDIINLIT
jgi:glycosyltransferase involved in cell wall biosynthesis